MGNIVYADLLFLVNFSMDFLCFFVTSQILHIKFNTIRAIVASAFGGIYSIAVLFLDLHSIFSLLVDISVCLIMCVIAFYAKFSSARRFFISFALYFGVCVGTGGFMTAIFNMLNKLDLPLESVKRNPDKISAWLFGFLAIISGVLSVFGGRIFKSTSQTDTYSIQIYLNEKKLFLKGFVDTGNLLKDPISGKPIILIESKMLSKILNEKIVHFALKGHIDEILKIYPRLKVRLIPISTANKTGLICAFVPDNIKIFNDKKRKEIIEVDALIAPCELCLNTDKNALESNALLPECIL